MVVPEEAAPEVDLEAAAVVVAMEVVGMEVARVEAEVVEEMARSAEVSIDKCPCACRPRQRHLTPKDSASCSRASRAVMTEAAARKSQPRNSREYYWFHTHHCPRIFDTVKQYRN